MRCPACDHVNPPGADECERCQMPLSTLDLPQPQGPVETSLMTDTVMVLQPRPPVTIAADAPLGAAMQAMVQHKVGALLVTDPQGVLIGILTERDFLLRIAGTADYERHLVRDYMTPQPETVQSSDILAVALARMDAGGYRHLPVVHNGQPVGVISIRDVLRHLTRFCME
ncbi:MAG: CBS domain-containing protein [Gemmataceae bacterium]|nr:CBS domain-containing protein [Gemmataceae bacterium]MCS7269566.1 CBS domain-containing protein [Gemmataceae bacterium]MDW8242376.1 CBS domain-containing protein [Thermogemmata sp.]